jgi:hypothetical protein
MEAVTAYYGRRIALGALPRVVDAGKDELAGVIALCPPSALKDRWTRRFPEPVTAFASGWMRVRARARQCGVCTRTILVFAVAFEGLQRSPRHKSGIAMRFPRISRLRFDKRPRDADRLETLEALLGRRAGPDVSVEGAAAGLNLVAGDVIK